MRVWILSDSEPMPCDPGARLRRAGLLAAELVRRGHDVTWWATAFHHYEKRQRVEEHTCVEVQSGYRLWLLWAPEYRRHVGLARVLHNRRTARAFATLAENQPPPDVVHSAMPTIDLPLAASRYCRRRGIPLLVDLRDLWPDLFVDLVPAVARPAVWLATRPAARRLREALGAARGLMGITEAFLDWGLGYAGRARGPDDGVYYLAYPQARPSESEARAAEAFWAERGLRPVEGQFVACFFGGLSRRHEHEVVLQAAGSEAVRRRGIRFVLCGDGDALASLRRLAEGMDNVLLPGWVGRAEIWSLMQMGSVGLLPYLSSRDMVMSIPNKAAEYFAGGLPVVSSIRGVMADLLEANRCGVTYDNGDAGALAEALVRLHDEPGLRAEMSANARALYERSFVAEKVYGAMADHVERVAGGGV